VYAHGSRKAMCILDMGIKHECSVSLSGSLDSLAQRMSEIPNVFVKTNHPNVHDKYSIPPSICIDSGLIDSDMSYLF
jgi:hypothetical protein